MRGKPNKPGQETDEERLIAENRRARYDFEVLGTLEVGLVLRGSEVKSVRDGNVSIAEGFVRVEGSPPQLNLYGVNIGEYGPSGPAGSAGQHRPTRARGLLAHKREIARLAKGVQTKGMTIVPLKLYFRHGYAKLLIALAKGRTRYDKRDAISKKEAARDIQRATSRRAP
ncbi:MAG: SsrA-binding protein SmpB [Phycisphaerae bacterium]|nr:SsrA-binding protein SmpB [Phycisphaerae bacterium]